MKIAITGHSAGIGQAFSARLSNMGHEIVGISKRDGNNIRNVPKVLDLIEPCDMLINNAQSGFCQTEILIKTWYRWSGSTDKMIWNIGTMMTKDTRMPQAMDGISQSGVLEYKIQKISLDHAFYQLRTIHHGPRMMMIRPGSVATQAAKVPDVDSADVHKWVNTVIDIFELSRTNNLWPSELDLGFLLAGASSDGR